MKKCTRCGMFKLVSRYSQRKTSKDGLASECKDCSKKAHLLYYAANQKKVKESSKKWSATHRINKRASSKKWQEANPEKWKACYLKSFAKKRATTKGKLNNSMASNIWQSLRENKAGRGWESLVGYTVDQLKYHLEKQFKGGMGWNNYGEWHIDHIIPISAFNYIAPEDMDFCKCWGLNNLRPLLKEDNLKKHNKLENPFQPSLII